MITLKKNKLNKKNFNFKLKSLVLRFKKILGILHENKNLNNVFFFFLENLKKLKNNLIFFIIKNKLYLNKYIINNYVYNKFEIIFIFLRKKKSFFFKFYLIFFRNFNIYNIFFYNINKNLNA